MRRLIVLSVAIVLMLGTAMSVATAQPWLRGDKPPRTTGPEMVLASKAIDPSGSSDVTNALNVFLANAPSGSTVGFPVGARYRIEGTLLVSGKTNLTIDGNGATFFATTDGHNVAAPSCGPRPATSPSTACRYPNRTRAQWNLSGDSGLTLRNLHVIGSSPETGPNGTYDPALEAQHAFNIVGVSGVVLDHVTARNVWGDLVYVGGASNNVIVENSSFFGASRQGWSVTNAQHVAFVNNTLDYVRRSLIDIEANTSHDVIAYLTIQGNRLGRSRFCTFTNYGAPAIEHDFVFANNQALNQTPIIMCIQARPTARRHNYEISGNVGTTAGVRLPNDPMLRIAYVDHVVVKNNVQRFWSSTKWPTRTGTLGSPQAPITAFCSTVTATTNTFTPRPTGMPQLTNRAC